MKTLLQQFFEVIKEYDAHQVGPNLLTPTQVGIIREKLQSLSKSLSKYLTGFSAPTLE